MLALAAPLDPTEIFRLAAPCQTHHCPHFDGSDCGLATRIVQIMPAVVDQLPPCQIRHECRWFRQEGGAACLRSRKSQRSIMTRRKRCKRWSTCRRSRSIVSSAPERNCARPRRTTRKTNGDVRGFRVRSALPEQTASTTLYSFCLRQGARMAKVREG